MHLEGASTSHKPTGRTGSAPGAVACCSPRSMMGGWVVELGRFSWSCFSCLAAWQHAAAHPGLLFRATSSCVVDGSQLSSSSVAAS